jgi:hypothetical protein
MIKKTFPIEKLVDYSFVDWATKQLPKFELINKESKLDGCQ